MNKLNYIELIEANHSGWRNVLVSLSCYNEVPETVYLKKYLNN